MPNSKCLPQLFASGTPGTQHETIIIYGTQTAATSNRRADVAAVLRLKCPWISSMGSTRPCQGHTRTSMNRRDMIMGAESNLNSLTPCVRIIRQLLFLATALSTAVRRRVSTSEYESQFRLRTVRCVCRRCWWTRYYVGTVCCVCLKREWSAELLDFLVARARICLVS